MSKYKLINKFFDKKQWRPFPFQKKAWKSYLDGKSGIVNAPTGSGKTYSLICPIIQSYINSNGFEKPKKLIAIWLSPIRALTEEIKDSAERFINELELDWEVGIRTGDTGQKIKQKQLRKMPEILITTPESLHVLLSSKKKDEIFRDVECIVTDEWHELLGSKRGVQVELAISHLKSINRGLRIWGISATIGNLEEAKKVLIGNDLPDEKSVMIKAKIKKKYKVITVMPDEIEKFPWAGHYGTSMLKKIIPIINENQTTLIFTNTRAQCEIWFRNLLDAEPDLAGVIAMHHGSIAKKTRNWVEKALHEKKLKVVVCTSSLDLGVDFRPVDAVIQIGGPKGVARFMQRAGRAGHRPGEISKIYFVPTHAIELIEAAGLKEAIITKNIESRQPYFRSFDVLAQYLVTLACGIGFIGEEIFNQIKTTFSYESMSEEEWNEIIRFITVGGSSLDNYSEFKKVELVDNLFLVKDKRIAMRHRLSIGTIVSDSMLNVKFLKGANIGVIEEWFISKLNPGDVFWFSGRSLELVKIKDMIVYVRKTNAKTGLVPSWQGGRMSLSSNMSELLRKKLQEASSFNSKDNELKKIKPLLLKQKEMSHLPSENELLIETTKTRDGYHLFVYPFEGRYVHEGVASLLAWRISELLEISFSIAFNDYGFELLSAKQIPIQMILDNNLLTNQHLIGDLEKSINSVELAKRKFRDIASISGLIFTGYPGNLKGDKHLQSSSSLIFSVLNDYEPDSIMLRQAYEEVLLYSIQLPRLTKALEKIQSKNIVHKKTIKPSPLSFPIIVDRLREKISSEKLSDRIKKMQILFEK